MQAASSLRRRKRPARSHWRQRPSCACVFCWVALAHHPGRDGGSHGSGRIDEGVRDHLRHHEPLHQSAAFPCPHNRSLGRRPADAGRQDHRFFRRHVRGDPAGRAGHHRILRDHGRSVQNCGRCGAGEHRVVDAAWREHLSSSRQRRGAGPYAGSVRARVLSDHLSDDRRPRNDRGADRLRGPRQRRRHARGHRRHRRGDPDYAVCRSVLRRSDRQTAQRHDARHHDTAHGHDPAGHLCRNDRGGGDRAVAGPGCGQRLSLRASTFQADARVFGTFRQW